MLRFKVNDQLEFLGSYTYQQCDWRSSAEFHETDRIAHPEHKFMIGARYSPLEDLHLSSHLYFKDDSESPDPSNPFGALLAKSYFRWDVHAEYEFWMDRGTLSVGVRNLQDSGHLEGASIFLNSGEVPRMIFGELTFRF
jgi:outer membrane receptor for monomeric catechols